MTERSWRVDLHKFGVGLGPYNFSPQHLDTKLESGLTIFWLTCSASNSCWSRFEGRASF
jgi:hypothetical protein